MNCIEWDINFEKLKGQIFTSITKTSDEIIFINNVNEIYTLHHHSDCCETVSIEDVTGNLADLLNAEILLAECVSNTDNKPHEYADKWLWTFYKLATINGGVTIRWLGESNGYYSVNVQLCRTN